MSQEPELMTEREIDTFMQEYGCMIAKRARREKRNRFARTWGLVILTAVLVVDVVMFARITGAL